MDRDVVNFGIKNGVPVCDWDNPMVIDKEAMYFLVNMQGGVFSVYGDGSDNPARINNQLVECWTTEPKNRVSFMGSYLHEAQEIAVRSRGVTMAVHEKDFVF